MPYCSSASRADTHPGSGSAAVTGTRLPLPPFGGRRRHPRSARPGVPSGSRRDLRFPRPNTTRRTGLKGILEVPFLPPPAISATDGPPESAASGQPLVTATGQIVMAADTRPPTDEPPHQTISCSPLRRW